MIHKEITSDQIEKENSYFSWEIRKYEQLLNEQDFCEHDINLNKPLTQKQIDAEKELHKTLKEIAMERKKRYENITRS